MRPKNKKQQNIIQSEKQNKHKMDGLYTAGEEMEKKKMQREERRDDVKKQQQKQKNRNTKKSKKNQNFDFYHTIFVTLKKKKNKINCESNNTKARKRWWSGQGICIMFYSITFKKIPSLHIYYLVLCILHRCVLLVLFPTGISIL